MNDEEGQIVRLVVSLDDGTYIIEYPDGHLERKKDESDWARVAALTEEEIEAAARADPEWEGLLDIDWSKAELVMPRRKEAISIRLDDDVLSFFKSLGAGYQTRIAMTGQEALERAAQHPLPDLVVLDLMLPDIPGTEVCRRLRSRPETREIPVLMLTARGEEIDRVVGFELGADDYVTKPFSPRELMLRIGAILRRAHAPIAISATRTSQAWSAPYANGKWPASIVSSTGSVR